MNLSGRDRRALILGGAVLAVIATYVFIAGPLLARYDALVTEHDRLAGTVARIVRDDRKAAYQTGLVAEYEKKAGPLTSPKPHSQQITAVSNRLVEAVQAGGIQMKNSYWTKPVPWAEEPALALASLHIDAEAPWENVFRFLAALHRIEGVLSVERLDLSGDPKKPGPLAMKLVVSVLVQAESPKPWAS